MPDALTQCIEREREAEDYATPPHPGNENCDTCAAVRAARAATDEAVRAVEGLIAAGLAYWHQAPDGPRASETWREWSRLIREYKAATPAPTAQDDSTGGEGDE